MNPTYWTIPGGTVKNLNKHVSLDRIRFTPGGISRVELARELHLTRAAITSLINDLLASGLVREVESNHHGGRKPIVLEVNPNCGHAIGLEMSATHLNLVLTDASARVLREWEEPFDVTRGPQPCIDQVDKAVRRMVAELNLSLSRIGAIGVGFPGPVLSSAGRIGGSPTLPGWEQFPLRDTLQKRWGAPVTLNHDAELGALGEWAFGVGRGESNLVYLKVDVGIGAGFLLDGQSYRGAAGSAGEIGHVVIREGGPLCGCGNRGCLEALAGGRAIVQKAIAGVKNGQRTRLSEIVPAESITAPDVLAAAQRGDLLSQQIVAEAGGYLGTAVAGLVNLFNPSMVVVGGELAEIGDLLVEPIRQAVQQRSLRAAAQSVRITTALLGRRSSCMGAVVQALSIFLHRLADQEGKRR